MNLLSAQNEEIDEWCHPVEVVGESGGKFVFKSGVYISWRFLFNNLNDCAELNETLKCLMFIGSNKIKILFYSLKIFSLLITS